MGAAPDLWDSPVFLFQAQYSRAFGQLFSAPWSIQLEILSIFDEGSGVPPSGIWLPAVPRSLRISKLPAPFPGMTAVPLTPPAIKPWYVVRLSPLLPPLAVWHPVQP